MPNFKNFDDFIRENDGDIKLAGELKSTLCSSRPGYANFPKSEHRYEGFGELNEDCKITSVAELLFQRTISSLSYSGCINSLDQKQAWANLQTLFGHTPLTGKDLLTESSITTVFQRAAAFKLTQLGACSFKATFAAIELRKIFKNNSNIEIYCESTPSRDHFTVKLGVPDKNNDGKKTWFVYDPLTNPTVFTPLAEYTKTILTSFEKVPKERQQPKMELEITDALAKEFEEKFPGISDEMKRLWQDDKPRFMKELPKDPFFMNPFRKYEIGKSFEEAITEASELINERLEKATAYVFN